MNHFEKIHPKDDLEIKKQRDESVGRTTNKKDNKKGRFRFFFKYFLHTEWEISCHICGIIKNINKFSTGKPSKKDSSPAVVTNAVEKVANVANDAVDAHLVAPLEVVAASVVAAPRESPKNTANKEKANKKKRNDAILIQQLGKFLLSNGKSIRTNPIDSLKLEPFLFRFFIH